MPALFMALCSGKHMTVGTALQKLLSFADIFTHFEHFVLFPGGLAEFLDVAMCW